MRGNSPGVRLGGVVPEVLRDDAAGQVDAVDETPTLLVTREIREHANVFHMLTDMLNAYISVRTMGWEGLPRQVVLLDNHPPGPFDPLWAAIAAGRGKDALAGPAGLPVPHTVELNEHRMSRVSFQQLLFP